MYSVLRESVAVREISKLLYNLLLKSRWHYIIAINTLRNIHAHKGVCTNGSIGGRVFCVSSPYQPLPFRSTQIQLLDE